MIKLPNSYKEPQKLPFSDRSALWNKYIPDSEYKRQTKALWYYIQCDRQKLKIEAKYMLKIKKYKENPDICINKVTKHKYNIPTGFTIIKTFRGVEHKVIKNDDDTFTYLDKKYKTLSAIAKDITGSKVSGPDFFGLNQNVNNDN